MGRKKCRRIAAKAAGREEHRHIYHLFFHHRSHQAGGSSGSASDVRRGAAAGPLPGAALRLKGEPPSGGFCLVLFSLPSEQLVHQSVHHDKTWNECDDESPGTNPPGSREVRVASLFSSYCNRILGASSILFVQDETRRS